MNEITKEELIFKINQISKDGWIKSRKAENHGGIGNTLESLLGIEENNLPIANANEWELKSQRRKTSSLITLFHTEPSPQAFKIVPSILLPNFGWQHNEAGKKYPPTEKSFRQTLTANTYTDRGFTALNNLEKRRVEIHFNSKKTSSRHQQWLEMVQTTIGLGNLDPIPYWGYDDLVHKIGVKLTNCFFVLADVKRISGVEYYHYTEGYMLQGTNLDGFIDEMNKGNIKIDFDARTGHNHGTKFRIKRSSILNLYKDKTRIL